MTQEIVVARYKENVDWVLYPEMRIFDGVRIYDKSGDTPSKGLPLKNEGKEAQTYLHHIVESYNSLADFTTFCQGKPFDHCPEFFQRLHQEPINGFQGLGTLLLCDHMGRPHCNEDVIPMTEICTKLGITGPEQPSFTFIGGAQFRVSREAIKRHPVEFYQNILRQGYEGWTGLNRWGGPVVHYWDMAHVMERSWSYLFR